MGSENMKHYLYRYVLEEKELRDTLARIKGEKDVKLGDIRRNKINFVKQHSRHFQNTCLPVVKEKTKDVVDVNYLDVEKFDPQTKCCPQNKCHPQNKCYPHHRICKSDGFPSATRQPAIRWSEDYQTRHEKYSEFKFAPPLKRRKTTFYYKRNNEDECLSRTGDNKHQDGKMPPVRYFLHNNDIKTRASVEDRSNSDTSTVLRVPQLLRTRSDSGIGNIQPTTKQNSLVNGMAHRVSSRSTWTYLMQNVFQRLNRKYDKHVVSDTGDTDRTPVIDNMENLKSCRYLRLPSLVHQTDHDDDGE